MALDILFLICVAAGFINGYRRGLIRAIFSFIAVFFGALLALKYSYIVSDYLVREQILQSRFLPIISFMIMLAAVLVLIVILSRLVEKIAEAMLLGFVNKLIGGFLEALIIVMLFSTVVWYLDKLHFISPELAATSKSYRYLVQLSPAVFSFVSDVVPFFSNVVEQLEELFKKLPEAQSEGGVVT